MHPEAGHSAEREQRLDEVVTAYLQAVAAGQTPEPQAWLARYPELAPELAEFFTSQEQIHRLAAPLRFVAQAALLATPPPKDILELANVGQAEDGPRPEAVLRSFGGYELLARIGCGGMGTVYRARQKALNRLVALKILHREGPEAAADVQRFQNEAEMVAQLDHPHIVPIYEVAEHEGRPYFSMKLVEGGSLATQLDPFRADPRAAARLLALVARAVHHAHQRGILHRDLKPANILLEWRAGSVSSPVPHVTDFGLAKRVAVDSGLTQSGAIVGTPGYMAAEQAAGRKGVLTTATDVYGLGAVLYALLTGRPPFQGETVLETLEQVKEREPTPPSAVNRMVDRDLETICLKCLDKEPQRRYGSAEALAEDLERYLGGEPIQARPIGRPARLWRWCRRNPALAVVSSLAVAALLTTTAVSVLFAVRESQNAENLGRALEASEANRRQAEQRLAENYLDRAHGLCEREEIGAGLLWLVRSLETAPEEATDLRRVIRTNLARWRQKLHALRAVFAHQGPVLTVAFSRDGRTVLTGSEDGTVRFWETATGKPLDRVLTHPGGVRALALSRDGRLLATVSGDPNARLPANLGHYNGAVPSSWRGGTIRFWEANTGKPLGPPRLECGQVYGLEFSPTGETFVTAGPEKMARLWQTHTGKPLGEPLTHAGELATVAFSRDGRKVATGCFLAPQIRLWDAATGQASGPPFGFTLAAWAVAFSPDGRTIVTGDTGYYARLWDAASGQAVGVPLQHRGLVAPVAFSPDGRTLLTGAYDKTVRLWQTSTGKPLGPPLLHPGNVQAVAFNPDGRSLVTGSWDGTGHLWEVAADNYHSPWLEGQGPFRAVVFSPDNRLILTGSGDGTVRLWEAATGKSVGTALPHPAGVALAVFSPDGQTILTKCTDGQLRQWETATARPIGKALKIPRVVSIAFSPDGRTFLTKHPTDCQLWEAATGNLIGTFHHGLGHPWVGHPSWESSSVALSPDGKFLLMAHKDQTAGLWEVATGQPVGEALPHSAQVGTVAFTPDGQLMLTATDDGRFQRWESATGKPLGPAFQLPGETGGQSVFSLDGQTVLTVYGDGKVWLRDVKTGKRLGPPLLHYGALQAAAFSRDSQRVLTVLPGGWTARWELPAPVPNEVERVACWVQVITGMALEGDAVHALDAATWSQRRRRLEELGGPPDSH